MTRDNLSANRGLGQYEMKGCKPSYAGIIASILTVLALLSPPLLTADSAAPPPAAGAVKLPAWLSDLAVRPMPALPAETEAVILLDERTLSIDAKGRIGATCRRAARVLRQGGIEEARALILSSAFDVKIKSMAGWATNPATGPRQVTMKDVISSSLAQDTLFMDAKIMILALPEVDVGSVVGFEWEEELTPPAFEDRWDFQGPLPVVQARYELSLPANCEPDFSWVNW